MGQHAIHDLEALAATPLRRDALAIAEAGYAAIDVGAALARELRIEGDDLLRGETRRPLRSRRVSFVGVGKCALAAAEAIEALLGERLTAGIALDVANPSNRKLSRIELFLGTHPLPSEENTDATGRILHMLSGMTADDLVIMLISGGGSTLLCHPASPMTPADERALFTALTSAGATIQELNTVRKHTSIARGGGLAKAAYPAEVLSFIVSDVPGNDIAFISSGPTVRDDSTVADAEAVLARYAIAPPAGTTLLETSKDDALFARVTNTLLLTNEDGLRAMQSEAERRVYAVTIVSDRISGEAREVGRAAVETLHGAPAKSVLLYAGETTVTLADPAAFGAGGRNQEMALAALANLREGEILLPFASDGHDNTDHAGAIADTTTREHARVRGLGIDEHLAAHRSYDFFTTTGDALSVGYTGSNVSDFIIAMKN